MNKFKTSLILGVLLVALSGFAQGNAGVSFVQVKENLTTRRPQLLVYSAATNVLGPILQLRRGGVIGVQLTLVGTNAAALSNTTAVFRYSNDAVNWTTTGNQSFIATANGTNVVTAIGAVTNTLNPRYGQLYYLTNAGSGATFTVNVSNVVTTVWDP